MPFSSIRITLDSFSESQVLSHSFHLVDTFMGYAYSGNCRNFKVSPGLFTIHKTFPEYPVGK